MVNQAPVPGVFLFLLWRHCCVMSAPAPATVSAPAPAPAAPAHGGCSGCKYATISEI